MPTSSASVPTRSRRSPIAAAPRVRHWRNARSAWPPSRPVFLRLLPDLAHAPPELLAPFLRRLPRQVQLLLREARASQRGETTHDQLARRSHQLGDEVA